MINQEAAIEIARQVRLRGIGGMILIDFIDMQKRKSEKGYSRNTATRIKKG
ncbi:MAG: ribonuclease E/G [Dialister invisus]